MIEIFKTTYTAGGRFDHPFYPTKQIPYSKGQMLEVEESIDVYTKVLTLPFDVEMLSVAIACSNYNVEDSWSLYVNNEIVTDEIYTKDLPEGIFLMAVWDIAKGTPIKLDFNNASGVEKKVWVTYQFLRDDGELIEEINEPGTETPVPQPLPEIEELPHGEVIVCPYATKEIGYAEIEEGTNELVITMEFSIISGAAFPDLNIEAPNGEKFGYMWDYLSTPEASETEEASSCSSASYTGYQSHPEEFVFQNPIPGKWKFYAQNTGGDEAARVRFSSTPDFVQTYEFEWCPGMTELPPEFDAPPVDPQEPPPVTGNYLYRFVATEEEDGYVDPDVINTNHWNLQGVDIKFWEGRNDLLNMWHSVDFPSNKSVVTITAFHKYLWQLAQDRRNDLVDFEQTWDDFIINANKDLVDEGHGIGSLSDIEKASIYLTYRLKKPVLIFPSAASILARGILDYFPQYIDPTKVRSLEWIDFNDVKTNVDIGGFALDTSNPAFRAYMNMEPSSWNTSIYSIQDFDILTPASFKFDGGNPIKANPLNDVLAKDNTVQKNDDKLIAPTVFIHELGHAIDYEAKTLLGSMFSSRQEWLNIGGWTESPTYYAQTPPQQFLLKPDKYIYQCTASTPETPVTIYSCVHPVEDFAETYAAYVMNPQLLQKYYPKRWAFMEAYVKPFEPYF